MKMIPEIGQTIVLLKDSYGERIHPRKYVVVDLLAMQFTAVDEDEGLVYLFYTDYKDKFTVGDTKNKRAIARYWESYKEDV